MKTYILREPKAVEPQKPVRTRRSAPAPASATTLLGPPAAPAITSVWTGIPTPLR
ncbi:MAG: hypothetical protein IT579_12840 [Verrucomicrobia subdivision 3 bacterium]|nr:hypothetical protein [Verrucomicrobiota bacterium]MCC6821611.1 hypothetical protein [Limisphaerales bacterium]